MVTRRGFGRMALGAVCAGPLAGRVWAEDNSVLAGVHLGMESYSLAPLPHDRVLNVLFALMQDLGLRTCSLFEPLIQPADLAEAMRRARLPEGSPAAVQAANAALQQWRMTVPLDYFRGVRKRFTDAGLDLYRYSAGGLGPQGSDAEHTRACEINRALGARIITGAMSKTVARRLIPFAERYDIRIGLQGRPDAHPMDADHIARLEDLVETVAYSPRYGIELDIGDATGAGFDVMPFLEANHARIFALNLKDRKRDRTSMPWGEGDTPVRAALQRIRDRRYPILCYLDVDYPTAAGGSRVVDVKRSMAYARASLLPG